MQKNFIIIYYFFVIFLIIDNVNINISLCMYLFRPYTRQCLPNASVATVGPTLGPNASLRAIRQKREMETRGDQDNQDKSDLQGKIQFYQQFCASQQNFAIAERKTQRNVQVGHSQQPTPSGNETVTATATRVANLCQFSTFKSTTPGNRAVLPQLLSDAAASLDLTGLSLGRSRELGRTTTELNPMTASRDHYQPTMSRTRERSPNTVSRQLDKQSYFFHGHKTEKDVDREVLMFEDLGTDSSNYARRKIDNTDKVAATSGSSTMNCFGGPDKKEDYADYDNDKIPRSITGSMRRLTMAYEMRRDSGNVEFLEKEGEIFKKTSSELLQDTSVNKRRNFSFRNKEKTHRSLESLERSIDLHATDCKSLDLLPEERTKTLFHGKQRSLDYTQKITKKTVDTTSKTRKRPNFFQRVGKSLHFLPRERVKRQDRLKQEEQLINSHYPQTDQEKCEYFLQRHNKVVDFFDERLSVLADRAPAQFNLGSFNEVDTNFMPNFAVNNSLKDGRLEKTTFRVTEGPNNTSDANTTEKNTRQSNSDASESLMQSDSLANTAELVQSRFLDPVASVATQETVSGNKDSMEIGYSFSQLGRLYLQNLQHVGRTDGLQSLEKIDVDAEKRECYLEWIAGDLDALSQGRNSSDSLTHGKPQGNFDILKGILFDIFVCICI